MKAHGITEFDEIMDIVELACVWTRSILVASRGRHPTPAELHLSHAWRDVARACADLSGAKAEWRGQRRKWWQTDRAMRKDRKILEAQGFLQAKLEMAQDLTVTVNEAEPSPDLER